MSKANTTVIGDGGTGCVEDWGGLGLSPIKDD